MLPIAALMLTLVRLPQPLPLSIPPIWESRAMYCQTFDAPDAVPDRCEYNLEAPGPAPTMPGGARGRSGAYGAAITLRGGGLSPHRPLTISFWWALERDATKDTGFALTQLQGRQGYISTFARSGPWCALTRTAGVLQIWALPGIQNINAIYDTALSDHVALKRGEWHHTALVITAASLVSVYTDGERVCQARLIGRELREDDGFNALTLGGDGVAIDEVVVLNRPLSDTEITDYARAVRQMREAQYPLR